MNPMGIGPTWQGNAQQPGTPTTSGTTDVGNPAPNAQVTANVGAPAVGNPLGINSPVPATPFVQPDTTPHTSSQVTVQALKAEALLNAGPLPLPQYQQPPDTVRVQVPVPPPNAPQISVGATYIPAADPARPVAPTIPVKNGDVLQLGNAARPQYQQPQDPPKSPTPEVVSDMSSASGAVLLEG
jgi:hypothetical protein